MKRWASLLLAVILALGAVSALADVYPLKRGSKGEEVEALQQMLFDLGFLDEEPDGIFGKKTQAAVKAWQKYQGVKQTGQMIEEAMGALDDTWTSVEGIDSEANATEEELKEWFVGNCYPFEEDGDVAFEYCWRHYQQAGLADRLKKGGMPAKMERKVAERLRDYWLIDIPVMYDEWEKISPEDAEANRSAYEELLPEFRESWAAEITAKNPNAALVKEALWLNGTGTDLCQIVHGALGAE